MDRVKAAEVSEWPKRAGEFEFTGAYRAPDVVAGMVFACPCGCGDVSAIDFDIPANAESRAPKWKWDGNRDAPTLSPSLHKTAGCRWHGWLRNGVFQEV